MPSEPRDAIDNLRDGLRTGERGDTAAARELLLGLSENLDLIPTRVGDYRHRDILSSGTRIAEAVGGDVLVASLEERDAAEAIVRWINETYDNEHTNQDYRKDIRAVGRYAREITEEPPASLAWIPTDTSNDFDPTPSERDLLTLDDEIRPMIEHAGNARDEALIALQFEAGLRGQELYELTVGDVFDAEHTTGVHVDGKEGERAVHLSWAVPYVNRWLSPGRHPAHDDAGAALWSKLTTADRVSYQMFLKAIREPAERAGVAKTATPTNLRKSNTRWLLRLGMNRGQIEQRQGRVHGSKHTARYEAAFGDDALEATYASLHGADVEVDGDDTDVAPVPCPRCGEQTPREEDFCIHCNQALDLAAKELVDSVAERFEAIAVESDEPADRQDAITAARTIRESPNTMSREELHELSSRLD